MTMLHVTCIEEKCKPHCKRFRFVVLGALYICLATIIDLTDRGT